jgi:Fibrobacter succinogenes major domain (Fib_succ_major).
MKDPRDNKTYRTVVVNGVTWMAENLNYEDHTIGKSNCYDDDASNCELYGRLYSRDAAMNDSRCKYKSSCDLGEGTIQGVCPDGWHIATKAEAQNLLSYVTSTASLKSAASTWSTPGTDNYGLSFVGAGNWDNEDGFEDMHSYEVMWLYAASTYQYFLLISSSTDVWDYISDEYYATVRCIKGEAAPVSSSSSSSSSMSSSSSKPQLADADPLLEAGTQFNSEITYGTMTDSRDSKTYKTVKIGNKTWMAENLNYAGNKIGLSFCFNDEDRFCDVYGRLYSRDAAMNDGGCNKTSCDLGDAPIQGICPDGWHIPSESEMLNLLSLAGNKALPLISAESWESSIATGSNSLGLSLIGAGDYDSSKHFEHLGEDAFVWVYAEGGQTYLVIRSSDNHAAVIQYTSTQMHISVRCVMD